MKQTVQSIDMAALPPGKHRMWFHLVDDALGLPIRLPLIIIRGNKPGPTLGLTAAVHGDEVNGSAAITNLIEKLEPGRLRGTLAAIPVTNVLAFNDHTRLTREGFDLNHHFPGSATGNTIQIYAHRLLTKFVSQLDMLIDLHTASRGRANCLYVRADMEQTTTARMAYLQRPQIILHNPASDGTLRGAAHEIGVPAITLEIGNPSRFQKDYIRRAVTGIRAVLVDFGMLAKRPVTLGQPPIICQRSQWLYTQRGGMLRVEPQMTEMVEKGEVIASVVDPFGDVVETYTAPFAGVVIGRAMDPVAASGARILHLGQVADDGFGYVGRDV